MERKTATSMRIVSRKKKRKQLRNEKKQLHHVKRKRMHTCTIPSAINVSKKSDKAASNSQHEKNTSKCASNRHFHSERTSNEDAEIATLEKKLGIASSADSKKTRANFKRLQR